MLSLLAQAGQTQPDPTPTIAIFPRVTQFQPLTTLTFEGVTQALISLVLIIAAFVFFFMLVIGGIRWITAGGDKAQTEAARGQLTAALIGIVIVFSAWAIIQIIQRFFGIKIVGPEAGFVIPTAQ